MEDESEFYEMVAASVAEEKAKEGTSEGELDAAASEPPAAPEAPSRACLVSPTQILSLAVGAARSRSTPLDRDALPREDQHVAVLCVLLPPRGDHQGVRLHEVPGHL